MHFCDQAPLRANAVEVADQQHADHQFGIERGTAYGAVIRSELLPHVAQIQDLGDLAQQMILGNVVVEAEIVKKRLLPIVKASQLPIDKKWSLGMSLSLT